jgi:hypothetical protein
LRKTLLKIADNPTSFAVRYGQFRKANLSKFPFGIFFFIENISRTVFVIGVKHD